MLSWLKARLPAVPLIDDVQAWWRLWSVRLNAVGLAVMGYVWFDPTALLTVVNMMPSQVREALPGNVQTALTGAIFAAALLARLVKQPGGKR